MPKKDKRSIDSSIENNKSLVADDDELFEAEYAEKVRESRLDTEEKIKLTKKREEEEKRAHEKKLHQEKIQLMRQKQSEAEGESESEDAVPEEEAATEKPKMSFWKKLENFWYHYKIVTIVSVIAVGFGGYMIYDLIKKVEPDMTIIVTLDNGMAYRTEELQDYFERYCEDLNGDGEIYVSIVSVPMNADTMGDSMSQSYQSKLFANMQSGKNVLYLTDDQSFFSIEQVQFSDLSKDIPDSEYATAEGLVFDCENIRLSLKWAQMPDDIVLKIRTPVNTTYDDDDMEKAYDEAVEMIKRMLKDY